MNFKNIKKGYFKKMHKKSSTLINFSIVWCFYEVGKTSLLPSALKFEKKSVKTIFLKKKQKQIYASYTKKTCGLKDNFSKNLLNFCPLNCTYLSKKLI